MDIAALAHSIVTVLVPALPYLTGAMQEAAEEAGKEIGKGAVAKLWEKLRPKIAASPAALEPARRLAVSPFLQPERTRC